MVLYELILLCLYLFSYIVLVSLNKIDSSCLAEILLIYLFFQEMDEIEKNLAAELEHGKDALTSQPGSQSKVESKIADEAGEDKEALNSDTTKKLEDKKKELVLLIFD